MPPRGSLGQRTRKAPLPWRVYSLQCAALRTHTLDRARSQIGRDTDQSRETGQIETESRVRDAAPVTH